MYFYFIRLKLTCQKFYWFVFPPREHIHTTIISRKNILEKNIYRLFSYFNQQSEWNERKCFEHNTSQQRKNNIRDGCHGQFLFLLSLNTRRIVSNALPLSLHLFLSVAYYIKKSVLIFFTSFFCSVLHTASYRQSTIHSFFLCLISSLPTPSIRLHNTENRSK